MRKWKFTGREAIGISSPLFASANLMSLPPPQALSEWFAPDPSSAPSRSSSWSLLSSSTPPADVQQDMENEMWQLGDPDLAPPAAKAQLRPRPAASGAQVSGGGAEVLRGEGGRS
eukprot:649498-Hanusia_phi.AAC.1